MGNTSQIERSDKYDRWLKTLEEALDSPMYRVNNTYYQNLADGPTPPEETFQDIVARSVLWWEMPQDSPSRFLDLELHSKLGVAAGPLLDSRWIKRCADLGYGILSYKTVRTQKHPSHSIPNIVCLDVPRRLQPGANLSHLVAPITSSTRSSSTITNSFGIPSQDPVDWMGDVEYAKTCLHPGQLLVVSVVGTPPSDSHKTDLETLAKDYARCGAMAQEAGADLVEANLSCPNTSGSEGDIYTNPQAAETVVRILRQQIPHTSLGLKLGYFDDLNRLRAVVLKVAPFVDFLVSVNAVKLTVKQPSGAPALDKDRIESGVCGYAIRDLGLYNVRAICQIRQEYRLPIKVIGCGGVMSVEDAKEYLEVGADAVETATAALWRPTLGMEWKINQ